MVNTIMPFWLGNEQHVWAGDLVAGRDFEGSEKMNDYTGWKRT